MTLIDHAQGGRCEKCGREFITLPVDLIDHYDLIGRDPRAAPQACGGKVIPRSDGEQDRSSNGSEG